MSLSFIHIYEQAIPNVIKTLDPNKAVGDDMIRHQVLERFHTLYVNHFAFCLTNLSLEVSILIDVNELLNVSCDCLKKVSLSDCFKKVTLILLTILDQVFFYVVLGNLWRD